MSKVSTSQSLSSWRARLSGFNGILLVSCALLILAGGVFPSVRSVVLADRYDNQINALKDQNAVTQNVVNGLVADATDYQDAISKLQARIGSLQSAINSNVAQQAELQRKITDLQHKIDARRHTLASDVKSMYVDGTPSTLEMLATSKNLSDFVDKQEYRNAVQSKLQTILQQISTLQGQLKDKKNSLDVLLKNLNSQKSQLASEKAKQASLLAYNRNQQSAYNAKLASNNAKINQLRAEQRAAYASLTGTGGRSPSGSSIQYKNMTGPQQCGGSYEYCYSSYGSCAPYTCLDQFVHDPWGFYSARECAHYAVDALHVRGYYVGGVWPAGTGNANRWVGYTTSTGLATLDSSPHPGDVVYMPIGVLGHVAIVDWVNSDGTVHVSQYNWYPGMYNTMDLYVTPGIQFLRFHH